MISLNHHVSYWLHHHCLEPSPFVYCTNSSRHNDPISHSYNTECAYDPFFDSFIGLNLMSLILSWSNQVHHQTKSFVSFIVHISWNSLESFCLCVFQTTIFLNVWVYSSWIDSCTPFLSRTLNSYTSNGSMRSSIFIVVKVRFLNRNYHKIKMMSECSYYIFNHHLTIVVHSVYQSLNIWCISCTCYIIFHF